MGQVSELGNSLSGALRFADAHKNSRSGAKLIRDGELIIGFASLCGARWTPPWRFGRLIWAVQMELVILGVMGSPELVVRCVYIQYIHITKSISMCT